jgi:hypothetical protein
MNAENGESINDGVDKVLAQIKFPRRTGRGLSSRQGWLVGPGYIRGEDPAPVPATIAEAQP